MCFTRNKSSFPICFKCITQVWMEIFKELIPLLVKSGIIVFLIYGYCLRRDYKNNQKIIY